MNIVLTGSSTGIGRAIAERLIARGHVVCGLARSEQRDLEQQLGARFRTFRCDVSVWGDVESAAAQVATQLGHVDALITCAGVQGEVGRALAADPAGWSQTVRVNLDGTFFALRAFDALLTRTARRAKVICFSGGGATKSRPRFSAYGVAKTGVVRLVETIAEEEKGRALDINAVAPGAINTRLTDEVLALGPAIVGEAEYAAAQKQKSTGGGSMEKVTGLIEWLLSPESDGITGRLLSAPWDPWPTLQAHAAELATSDIYTLRRITAKERGKGWET